MQEKNSLTEHRSQSTRDLPCNHNDTKSAKGWPYLQICKSTNSASYKGVEIIRSNKSYWNFKEHFVRFVDNEDREKAFKLMRPISAPIISKDFSVAYSQLSGLGRRLRLSPNTLFLGSYLAKNYISALEKARMTVDEKEVIEIAHTTLFLASKMRERDIYCPMSSHISRVGGGVVSEKKIKKREIEISHFFDWNICMMTYYDFLEQFMLMGMIYSNDQVKRIEEDTPSSPAKTDNGEEFNTTTLTIDQDSKKGSKSRGSPAGGSFDSSRRSNSGTRKSSGSVLAENSTKHGSRGASPIISPQNQRGEVHKSVKETPCSRLIDVGDLTQDEINKLVEDIERRCLDLAQQIGYRYLTDSTIQREIAYLIIVVSRKQNGIINYDNALMRDYFRIGLRSGSEFKEAAQKIINECPDLADQLKFDLVIRQYNEEGTEILPGYLIRELEEQRKKKEERKKQRMLEKQAAAGVVISANKVIREKMEWAQGQQKKEVVIKSRDISVGRSMTKSQIAESHLGGNLDVSNANFKATAKQQQPQQKKKSSRGKVYRYSHGGVLSGVGSDKKNRTPLKQLGEIGLAKKEEGGTRSRPVDRKKNRVSYMTGIRSRETSKDRYYLVGKGDAPGNGKGPSTTGKVEEKIAKPIRLSSNQNHLNKKFDFDPFEFKEEAQLIVEREREARKTQRSIDKARQILKPNDTSHTAANKNAASGHSRPNSQHYFPDFASPYKISKTRKSRSPDLNQTGAGPRFLQASFQSPQTYSIDKARNHDEHVYTNEDNRASTRPGALHSTNNKHNNTPKYSPNLKSNPVCIKKPNSSYKPKYYENSRNKRGSFERPIKNFSTSKFSSPFNPKDTPFYNQPPPGLAAVATTASGADDNGVLTNNNSIIYGNTSSKNNPLHKDPYTKSTKNRVSYTGGNIHDVGMPKTAPKSRISPEDNNANTDLLASDRNIDRRSRGRISFYDKQGRYSVNPPNLPNNQKGNNSVNNAGNNRRPSAYRNSNYSNNQILHNITNAIGNSSGGNNGGILPPSNSNKTSAANTTMNGISERSSNFQRTSPASNAIRANAYSRKSPPGLKSRHNMYGGANQMNSSSRQNNNFYMRGAGGGAFRSSDYYGNSGGQAAERATPSTSRLNMYDMSPIPAGYGQPASNNYQNSRGMVGASQQNTGYLHGTSGEKMNGHHLQTTINGSIGKNRYAGGHNTQRSTSPMKRRLDYNERPYQLSSHNNHGQESHPTFQNSNRSFKRNGLDNASPHRTGLQTSSINHGNHNNHGGHKMSLTGALNDKSGYYINSRGYSNEGMNMGGGSGGSNPNNTTLGGHNHLASSPMNYNNNQGSNNHNNQGGGGGMNQQNNYRVADPIHIYGSPEGYKNRGGGLKGRRSTTNAGNNYAVSPMTSRYQSRGSDFQQRSPIAATGQQNYTRSRYSRTSLGANPSAVGMNATLETGGYHRTGQNNTHQTGMMNSSYQSPYLKENKSRYKGERGSPAGITKEAMTNDYGHSRGGQGMYSPNVYRTRRVGATSPSNQTSRYGQQQQGMLRHVGRTSNTYGSGYQDQGSRFRYDSEGYMTLNGSNFNKAGGETGRM